MSFLNNLGRAAGESISSTLLWLAGFFIIVGLLFGGVLVSCLRSDAVDDYRLEEAARQSHADQELRNAQAENADAAARGDVRDRLRDGGAVFAVPDRLRDAD